MHIDASVKIKVVLRDVTGRTILEERVATLLASGYLVATGQLFRLTPRGRALAQAFAFVKATWRLEPGG